MQSICKEGTYEDMARKWVDVTGVDESFMGSIMGSMTEEESAISLLHHKMGVRTP
jgi:hypothetical protein